MEDETIVHSTGSATSQFDHLTKLTTQDSGTSVCNSQIDVLHSSQQDNVSYIIDISNMDQCIAFVGLVHATSDSTVLWDLIAQSLPKVNSAMGQGNFIIACS